MMRDSGDEKEGGGGSKREWNGSDEEGRTVVRNREYADSDEEGRTVMSAAGR